MERILVTGATGMIGFYVLQNLIRRGLRPVASIRNQMKLEKSLREYSDIILLDYNDSTYIKNSLSTITKVFLVPPMHPNMSTMMKNVLSKMEKVKAIVCISASGADSESAFPLLKSHGEIKNAIIETGIAYTFLTPAHFYQNYIQLCAKPIREEHKFYFPQGNSKKSMIDAYDIGEIAARILTEEGHVGKTYTLAGYDYNNTEIASTFTNVLEKNVNYVDIEPEEYKKKLVEDKTPDWKIEILLKLNAAWKTGSRLKSNQETKFLLGRNPRTFEEFLQENKEWF